jgi:endonuclease IV
VRETAEAVGVELHVKAPYYVNLAGDAKNVDMSFHKIVATGKLADVMGAQTVVFHPGFYGELSKEETMARVVTNLRNIRSVFVSEGWRPRLGMEIMGKRNVFGSHEEVIEVCQKVKGIVPVIDLAHIHARGNGILQDPEDFQAVFDKLDPLQLEHFLIHFTGVHYENGNARYRLPIKKGDLKFEPLCEVLLENNYHATILSTSPILEHDAMYMNIVFDRVKERRDARVAREVREHQEAEERAKRDEEKRLRKVEEEEAKKRAAEEELMRQLKLRIIIQSDDSGRRQVQIGPYKLYKKESRYYFMKEKKDGFGVVFKVPNGKHAVYGANGVPILKQSPIPGQRVKVVQTDDSGRRQVQADDYKLYRKDNRFYFMKEKKDGFSLVFRVPDDKEVVYGANGVPLVRAKS